MGLWQVLSLIPGTSRSGITISRCPPQWAIPRSEAARLSMLMSIPTIIASGVLLGAEVAAKADGAAFRDGALAALFAFAAALLALTPDDAAAAQHQLHALRHLPGDTGHRPVDHGLLVRPGLATGAVSGSTASGPHTGRRGGTSTGTPAKTASIAVGVIPSASNPRALRTYDIVVRQVTPADRGSGPCWPTDQS